MAHPLPWLLAAALALVVVILGAYTRLSDAGLGCPDWPGCYGHVGVPASPAALDRANEAFAHRPVEPAKAWKEMVHRYAAGLLGLMVLALTVSAWRRAAGRALATALLALIIFQAALGMWTVTLLLKPVVVMGHLLGGFSVLSLLWLGYLGARSFVPARHRPPVRLRRLALLGIVVLVVQIALGGWTSANYAALACPTFPKCMGEWWPPMDMADGFVMWRGLGVNYEFGVLDSPARVAVHMAHRAWAVVTFLYLGAVGIYALRQPGSLRAAAAVMLTLLVAQVSLGIANIWLHLPLPVAAAHNAVAALLLLALLTLTHTLYRSGTARG
ncbi:MAG: COX15/CtaA family protein [Immundisolibacter sp.]|nr:COX15/CtaA family protein [Immundisolibacter sp.]